MRRYMYGVYVCASGLYLNNNNGSGGYSCKTCVPTVTSTIVVTRMYPYCTTNPKNNHHTRMYVCIYKRFGALATAHHLLKHAHGFRQLYCFYLNHLTRTRVVRVLPVQIILSSLQLNYKTM